MPETISIFQTKVTEWAGKALDTLPEIVLAIVIFIVIKKFADWIRWALGKVLARTHLDEVIQRLICLVVQVAITFLGLLGALAILGLDKTVTSVLAGLGLVGLALGYAFQDIIANFISGVFISVNDVIDVGDYIEADGHKGEVVALSLRTTTLLTPQGQHVLVPNSAIFENTTVNYTASGRRRVDIYCGVSYDADLTHVEEVVRDVIAELELRNPNEDISFNFMEFSDSAITFRTTFWIRGTSGLVWLDARSEAIQAIKNRFDQEGIEIPFPMRVIYQKKK